VGKAAAKSVDLEDLKQGARVTVRKDGAPDRDGRCVVYWMQRAQRGTDNHAVDLAVEIANRLGLPLVVYFAGISNFPHANLRHYVFLNQGLPDIEQMLASGISRSSCGGLRMNRTCVSLRT
jgi:deoxyribodipyrimidine photo-lyase